MEGNRWSRTGKRAHPPSHKSRRNVPSSCSQDIGSWDGKKRQCDRGRFRAVIALMDVLAICTLLYMRRLFIRAIGAYREQYDKKVVEIADFTVLVTGLPHNQNEIGVEEDLRACAPLPPSHSCAKGCLPVQVSLANERQSSTSPAQGPGCLSCWELGARLLLTALCHLAWEHMLVPSIWRSPALVCIPIRRAMVVQVLHTEVPAACGAHEG